MLKILSVVLVVGVFLFGWYRNDLRRLTRDYACNEPFEGALQHCIVRFPLDEMGTECMLGANGTGLYLSSSADAVKRNKRWSFRYHVIGTPLFIPWESMQVADAKFPLRRYLRFRASNKAIFFIPREAARSLLGDGMRPVGDVRHT